MPCPQCRHETPPDAQFCPQCGTRLALSCAQCGTENAPGHNFCKKCGQPLGAGRGGREAARFASPQAYTPKHLAEKILTSKSALEGERKQVTVLFCDIANSTGLAERLGPEAMHDLLDRFFELALDEVHRYEGTVNQFLGDGFMALFGAPIAHEDDARRGVLSALGIQRRLRERRRDFQQAAGNEVAVRIGLNTGFVVVGRIGDNLRMDYTAVGDTTNLAARLQQVAEPGLILISETTHRLLHGVVRAERIDEMRVKGKSEPVTAYRLVGLGARRSPLEERPAQMLGRFVGRQREVGTLQDLFANVVAGQGQVVGVVGEPGMGKSRLLYEFRRALSGRPATVLEGRCVSYGGSIPYLPLLDILRNNCGIADGDDPDVIADKLSAGLAEVGMAPGEYAMFLLHLFGVKEGTEPLDVLSPEAIKARTFETIRQMSLKGSARRPLVLLVEDVHWVDTTSEEYLAYFIDSLTAAPIFLLTTYRPGYRPPWMDRSYATQITLRPLTRDDSLSVVQSAAQSDRLSAALSETILSKAEGNPFFLEELALAVTQQSSGEHAIPDTVQGVLSARIDRLSEGTKRLVRTASVLGREFSLKLLDKVWEGPGPLHPHLLELKRLEFVYERASGDEPVYVFKHALTQDVAYDGLLTHRRHALHAAAGRALEELHGDRLEEVDGALAYHYARSELADKAITYLVRVADKAARVYANAEAIVHLREALAHLERVPADRERDRLLLDVILRQGFSLYFLGRFAESVEVLLQHRERLEALGDAAIAGPYYFWLSHMYSRLGNQELAAQTALRAIEDAERCGDEATLGKAHGLLALEGHWAGRCLEGIEHGRRAVALLERTSQHWWLGMAHFYVAMNYMTVGRFEEALAATASADAVGRSIADPRLQTYAGFTAGWIACMRGELDVALEACERSRALAPDRVSRVYAAGFLGLAHVERGDAAAAIPLLAETVDELERFGFPQWHGMLTGCLAEAQRLSGRLDDARALAARGLEITRRAQYWFGVGIVLRAQAHIALDAGEPPRAWALLEETLATYASIGAQFEIGRIRLELASLAAATRDATAAAEHLGEAHRLFTTLRTPRYRERAEHLARELGIVLQGPL
jgi:class 3 adenylate cyclase/tetratricopeptide (TPR) repeat protein